MPELAARRDTLPIADATLGGVIKTTRLTLKAMETGAAIQPPDAILVVQLADVRAYAEGLGAAVAEAQELLRRFSQFVLCNGELDLADLGTIRYFVERGLEACGLVPPPPARNRGQPATTFSSARAVQQKLVHRWRDHRRDRYSARQAIRDVAEEEVLELKRLEAAWSVQDHVAVALVGEDEDRIVKAFCRIEVACYRLPKLTDLHVAVYRRRSPPCCIPSADKECISVCRESGCS